MLKSQKTTTKNESPAESHGFTVEIPNEGFSEESVDNLRKIIASKESIIKKAIGSDDLAVKVDEDKLRFPWFTLNGTDGETDAYTKFICAICNMAKTQKRVTAKEQPVENEKFTMRLFLIRLGFIGEEYKIARKILLSKLTGNGSWRYGQPPKKVVDDSEVSDESDPEYVPF